MPFTGIRVYWILKNKFSEFMKYYLSIVLQYHYGLLLNATFRVKHEIIEYIIGWYLSDKFECMPGRIKHRQSRKGNSKGNAKNV